jgi:hypothetical protein
VGCLDVEIFEKTICSHTRQWSRKGESPTAVGERLTGDGCAGNYKELLIELAVILGNGVDEPGLFKLSASENRVAVPG